MDHETHIMCLMARADMTCIGRLKVFSIKSPQFLVLWLINTEQIFSERTQELNYINNIACIVIKPANLKVSHNRHVIRAFCLVCLQQHLVLLKYRTV